MSNIKQAIKNMENRFLKNKQLNEYYVRYRKYSFSETCCKSKEQYEAAITRFTHTIEKGLSYENYKPGFGQRNIQRLIELLKDYSTQYDTNETFFQTALCCLKLYVARNEEYTLSEDCNAQVVEELVSKYGCNDKGGTIKVNKNNSLNCNFEELMKNRHSIRHFSGKPLDIDTVHKAIELAQYTPSACNRQGWKARIISDHRLLEMVLKNQNGNRGFGNEFDKLLLITSDLRYFNSDRELFQAFIDGGMYSESIINSLFYYSIGAVPLSASLTLEQEKNVRKILNLDDAEVLIMFIGIGNYPDEFVLTAKSERHESRIIEL